MNIYQRTKTPFLIVMGLVIPGLVAFGDPAKAGDDSLRLIPHWKKGETRRYSLVKRRHTIDDGKLVNDVTSRRELTLEVLQADKEGFLVSWVLGETTVDNPKQNKHPLVRKMKNLLKDYRVILKLNSIGTIEGVENWKELQATAMKTLKLIMPELKKQTADLDLMAKIRDQLVPMVAGKAQIEQFCTRDAQLFFLLYHFEFDESDSIEYDNTLPNPFGGEPFPCKARIDLNAVDDTQKTAQVAWRQTVKPEDTRRIMAKTMKNMAKRLRKPIPGDSVFENIRLEDSAEITVEMDSCWIRELMHKRVIKTGTITQVDTVTFKKKY